MTGLIDVKPVGREGNKWVFSTRAFNKAADIVQGTVGMTGGRNIQISRISGRTVINLDRRGGWLHPWFTSVEWRPDNWLFGDRSVNTGEFWVRVRPGFVNGVAPDVPALAYSYYETDEEDSKVTITPTLLEDWAFPVPHTRAIRGRGIDGEPVPKYFRDMGVVEEKSGVAFDGADGNPTINTSEQEESGDDARLLRAADIVLTAHRPSYKLAVDLPGNLITGQLVDYSVQFDASNAFRKPSIGAMPKIPKGDKESEFLQRLMGNMGDSGIDQILVSTVYFISPPKKLAKKTLDKPTDEWTPIVKHSLFWNLGYHFEAAPPFNWQQLNASGVLAFVGRYTWAPAAALGAMEAMMDAIITAAFNKPPKGTFYTA